MRRSLAHLTCLVLSLMAGSARAHGDGAAAVSGPMEGKESSSVGMGADGPDRRTALRAALLAQRESASRQEPARLEGRQLTERERAELRQQVRQQRRPAP